MPYVVLVLQYVHGSLEDPKTLTHHKLIHTATERVLTDTKTVAEENIKNKGRYLVYLCVSICLFIYMYVCIYVYTVICIYVCIHLCM